MSFKEQDQKLTAEYLAGDESAFAKLYQLHAPYARGWAARFAHGNDSSNDIVSESFTRVLEAMRKGGGPRVAVGPYLISTIRNVAVSRAKDLNKEVSVDDVEPYMPEVAELVTGSDRVLIEAFNGLSEQQQLVLWLKTIEAMRGKDIARIMGIGEGVVGVRYHRAKQALAQKYMECVVAENLPPDHDYSAEEIVRWIERSDIQDALDGEPRKFARGKTDRKGLRDKQISAHVERCEHCQDALVARKHMLERFRIVVLILPVSVALGITSRAVPASAAVASSTAPGWIAFALAGVVAVVIGFLIAGGVRGEPTRTTPQSGVAQETIVSEPLDVGAFRGCEVVYVADEESGRFEISDAGDESGGCEVTVFHEGEKLGGLQVAGNWGVISAPRSGEYVVKTVAGGETKEFRIRID